FKGKPSAPEPKKQNKFDELLDQVIGEMARKNQKWWNMKVTDLETYSFALDSWDDDTKVNFIIDAVHQIEAYNKGRRSFGGNDPEWQKSLLREAIIRHILKTRLTLSDSQLQTL